MCENIFLDINLRLDEGIFYIIVMLTPVIMCTCMSGLLFKSQNCKIDYSLKDMLMTIT